jgi:Protein of unknown function (DUF2950)
MFNVVSDRRDWTLGHLVLAASIALLLPSTACQKQDASTVQAGPTTFSSPEEAGKALAAAAGSQDQNELKQIFGPGSTDLISSGDAVEDKGSLSQFAQAYKVMNRWRRVDDSTELLLVGANNQAFPVPLVKASSGQWYFDSAAGKEEILSRRIGSNEISAIAACNAVVDAQAEYFSQKRGGAKQYAQKFISDPGQQDGLYWNSPQGSPRSPLGPLVAYATAQGYKLQPGQHQPFNGYYFAMLEKQGPDAQGGAKSYVADGKMTGGFALVAYPAHYGDSGIMTFIVNQNGAMFQKDLGKGTDEIASAMTDFNPDKSWNEIQ